MDGKNKILLKFEKMDDQMFFTGIQIEGKSIRIAKLRQEKKRITLELLSTLHSPTLEILNAPAQEWEAALCKEGQLITGLSSHEVFLRTIHLPLIDTKKILAALPFQIEELLPFPTHDAFIAPIISKNTETGNSSVQVIAAQKKTIKSHLENCRLHRIDPDIISCGPIALTRFFSFFYPDLQNAVLFHIEAESSCGILILGGKLQISYPFFIGINHMLRALGKDFPDLEEEGILEKAVSVNLLAVSTTYMPNLFEILLTLRKEIDRILSFFQIKSEKELLSHVILTGDLSCFSRLHDFFTSSLSQEWELLSGPSIDSYDASTITSYAVPIGLALDAGRSDITSLQLRQNEFRSQKNLQKRIRSLLIYTGVCALLSCTLFCMASFMHKKEENALQTLCSTYFPEKNGLPSLELKISSIERKIGKQKKSSPFVLAIASVSEVLAWLSTHPILNGASDSFINMDLLDIRYIKYQITKHPKLSSPNILPVGKVDLEFTCSSSKMVREFHDSLLKGGLIVDPKKEITWDVKESIYRTSFFLRPKGNVL